MIAAAASADADRARDLGAAEVVDPSRFDRSFEPVDLVFDTAGGDVLQRAMTIVRAGGRLVSVAEEPSTPPEIDGSFFIVEPNRAQLLEITRLVEHGDLLPAIDAVFPLVDAKAAFARSMERGKRGKVVLRVTDEAIDG